MRPPVEQPAAHQDEQPRRPSPVRPRACGGVGRLGHDALNALIEWIAQQRQCPASVISDPRRKLPPAAPAGWRSLPPGGTRVRVRYELLEPCHGAVSRRISSYGPAAVAAESSGPGKEQVVPTHVGSPVVAPANHAGSTKSLTNTPFSR